MKYYVVTVRQVSKEDYDRWNEGEALPSDTFAANNAEKLWETATESERPLSVVAATFGRASKVRSTAGTDSFEWAASSIEMW